MTRSVHRLGRWAGEAHWQLLSFHKGHIVKRMNNGLMMEFADARSCLQAAFALGQLADSASRERMTPSACDCALAPI